MFLLFGTTNMFCSLGIPILWFAKKSFSFHTFHKIKVRSSNDTNLDSNNNVHLLWFSMRIMFSSLGYTILVLWFCNKSFSLHHFSSNQSSFVKWDKLDSHDNLQVFVIGHHKHVLLFRIHDIGALVLPIKDSFNHFP